MFGISNGKIFVGIVALIAFGLFVFPGFWAPSWMPGHGTPANNTGGFDHKGEVWMGDKLGYVSQDVADALNASVKKTDDDSQSESLIYTITDFKDWTNGKLEIDTDVNDIEVFPTVDDAQSIVDDVWNNHHDRKWNIDNSAIEIANKYGDDDPAKSIFYSSSDMFVVTKKSSGIGPQIWSPDKDGQLIKVTPKNKSVSGTDKLAKEA